MTEIEIKHVGRKGDGIGQLDGQDVFVPFTLPGDHVEISGSGSHKELISVNKPSENRIEPVCSHFGLCGGCQLQHMSASAYAIWKQELALEPLRKLGITNKIQDLISFTDQSRRKVVFNLYSADNRIILGFTERASHQVVEITECAIMVTEISENLVRLKDLAVSVPLSKIGTRMAVLATSNGLDISIDGAKPISESERQVLIRKAIAHKFSRLTIEGETIIETRKPILLINNIAINPPPGCFVQAVKEAENIMVEITSSHLKSCKRIADLYCGIGTFALPLARHSTVWGVEENKPALNTLDQAWRETAGTLKQIKTEARNLERRPVTFSELKKIDGVIFDPPRTGAELQAKQIAKSKVKKVVAVSCNPVTLARDLEILIAGGFRIDKIIPIDQFKYTPHVEMVVTLER